MAYPEFARGLEDARNGRPFDWTVGSKHPNAAWQYERGRAFGFIAPLNMPLRIGSKLNPKAVALCRAAFDRKLVV